MWLDIILGLAGFYMVWYSGKNAAASEDCPPLIYDSDRCYEGERYVIRKLKEGKNNTIWGIWDVDQGSFTEKLIPGIYDSWDDPLFAQRMADVWEKSDLLIKEPFM